jgi:cell shape-determining protein MreD
MTTHDRSHPQAVMANRNDAADAAGARLPRLHLHRSRPFPPAGHGLIPAAQAPHRCARSCRHGRPSLPGLALPGPGTIIIILAVVAAMVLGGGTTNPQTETILQPLMALILLPLAFTSRLTSDLGRISPWAWALAGLIVVIPAVQLIPLPPSVWQALPGRGTEVQTLRLLGQDQAWMPWSLSPARTFASLIAIVCPLLVLLQASRLSLGGRTWLCAAIVGMALVSLLLGVLQLSRTGGYSWSIYSYYHVGYVVGFHANHNAETDVMQIGLLAFAVLTAALFATRAMRPALWVIVGAGFFLGVLADFLTGSRTGIALLPVALAGCALILRPWLRLRLPRSRRVLRLGLLAVTLAIAAVGAVGMAELPAIQHVIERFSDPRVARLEIWRDTIFAIQSLWPMGSGVGSFPCCSRVPSGWKR